MRESEAAMERVAMGMVEVCTEIGPLEALGLRHKDAPKVALLSKYSLTT